jgi:hypothetical protein
MTAQILTLPSVTSDIGRGGHLPTRLDTDMDKSTSSPAGAPEESSRGRRRTREAENDDDDDLDGENGTGPGSSKKRRRSRKGLDKKFECPHEGCGKSYSRAEHLYRHQLNRKFTQELLDSPSTIHHPASTIQHPPCGPVPPLRLPPAPLWQRAS